jgi:hypothetical protein
MGMSHLTPAQLAADDARAVELRACAVRQGSGSIGGSGRAPRESARDRGAGRQGLEAARARVSPSSGAGVLANAQPRSERLVDSDAAMAGNPDDASWGSREATAPR